LSLTNYALPGERPHPRYQVATDVLLRSGRCF
jgi:hypothetical protein